EPRRSGVARRGPEVDPALRAVAVDLLEFLSVEVEPLERRDVLLELANAARADQGRGDARVAQDPGDGELRQRLTAPGGDLVEGADAGEVLLADQVGREVVAAAYPRVILDALEVPVGQQ